MQIWYTHRWCPLQLSALNKSISLVCQNIVNTLLETVSQSKILNNKFWYEIASYIGTSAPLHCLRLFIRLVAGFVWVLNKRKREDSQLRSHFIHPFFIILCSHISLESVFSQLHQIWVQQGRDCSRIFCQKRPKDDFSSADSMIAGLTLNKKSYEPKKPGKMPFVTLVQTLVQPLRSPTKTGGPQSGKGWRCPVSPASRKGALTQALGLSATWEMVCRLRTPEAIISKYCSHLTATRSTSCCVCAFQETKLCCELLVMLIAFFPLEICSCFGPKYFKTAVSGSKSHGKKKVMHVNFWFRHDENFILFIKIPLCQWDVPLIHGLYLVMLLCEISYMQSEAFKHFCCPLLPNITVIVLLTQNMFSFQLDGCMFI